MEANEIKEAMAFFAIIFNRGDGFWARRWKFFELINNRGDTIIRSHRVAPVTELCPIRMPFAHTRIPIHDLIWKEGSQFVNVN